MFKRYLIVIMLPQKMMGMLIPPPLLARITINNHYNYIYNYHHYDADSVRKRVNFLERGNKKLRMRINKLEKRVEECKKDIIFSRAISYYGLLGMSAMLSAIMVQYGAGFIEFPHTTFKEVASDLGIIAACGYGASLLGVACNKVIDIVTKQKPNPKVDWLLPTAFGAFGFLISWKPLEKIFFTSPEDVKRMAIGGGLFVATTFLSGAIIHFAHHKWYGTSK